MTKQRYLAELSRLLVFMTEEDREEIIRRYGAMFDEAGIEGEAALVEKLGSPTKAAIGLSRGYEPGSIHVEAPVVTPKRPEAPEKAASDGELWDELPEFHLPGMDDDEDDEADAAPAPAENEPPRKASLPPVVVAEDDEWPDELSSRPAKRIERTMPLGLGIPLFVFVMLALGLPLAAVCLAVMLVLLVPGGALLFAAYLVFVGGLWCTAYMSDAILLFGAALIVLAAAILVFWLGLWLDGKLASAYGRGVGWLAGELLGRKVSDDE